MTAPKSRGTKSKRDKRRLHIVLKKPNLVKCKKCGKLIQSHIVCSFCGYYKGRQIIDVLKKKDKKKRKEEESKKKRKEKEEDKKKEIVESKKTAKK